jgi:hypothetical protein
MVPKIGNILNRKEIHMKMTNYCMAALLSVSLAHNAQAITMKTAQILTAATGAGLFGGSYYLLSNKTSISYPLAWAAGGSALATWGAWYLFRSFTPEGRVDSARRKINRVSRNPMAMQHFSNDRVFFDALQEVYIGDDLWLVSAYNEMSSLLSDARYALDLIDTARAEASSYNNIHVIQQCNSLSPYARQAIINLTDGLKMVRNNPEYIKQVKIYKEMLAAEQKLQVQQQMADAQSQMAHAQMIQATRR